MFGLVVISAVIYPCHQPRRSDRINAAPLRLIPARRCYNSGMPQLQSASVVVGPKLLKLGAIVLPAMMLGVTLACSAPDPVVEGIRGSETVAGPIRLRSAWGLQPFTNAPLPGYLRIVNLGAAADTLLGVRSEAAGMVRLHGSADGPSSGSGQGGGMTMLSELVIPAGDSLLMAPGGMHLMLEQLRRRVVAGDTVAVVLKFANAGEVELLLPVVGYELLERLK
jgi:copper(I)-binding protein